MAKQNIIIANGGGFWGDDPTAARRQVEGGPVDYLVMDYLAEVTMAILQKQRQKNPEAGFATDFVRQLRDVLTTCVERDIKIISNAGGVNPLQCKAEIEKLAAELGIADRVTVGVVLGDDIYDQLDELIASDEPLNHMDSGEALSTIREKVLSANVYLGASALVKALEMGANVIIAGRVTDTSVTLAPMIYEFGWAADDWDRLAAGIVAGHIIECGAQCTGGNFTDWHKVPSYKNIGYPLVDVNADGSFAVTKHPGTGGLITVHTITEQLLYEMGAPAYLAPDCIARFDSIQLKQAGVDRVEVSAIRGAPAPQKLKVSVSFSEGYRAFGRLIISGIDTRAKAEKVAETIWDSVGGLEAFADAMTQYVGWNACHPALDDHEPGEIMLQLAVRDHDRQKINQLFAPQLVPKVLGSVPGITYLADQGRPRASDVIGYWPALISRERLKVRVVVGDETVSVSQALATDNNSAATAFTPTPSSVEIPQSGQRRKVRLAELCLARSGDKGDTCNVGICARSPEIYAWMCEYLTADFVKTRFAEICKGAVQRFEVPNILALNFLLHESLGGGGTLSLILDAQGKTYAQFLLATEVEVDEALLATLRD